MNNEEMNVFKFIVAVAVASTEYERPRLGDITGESACRYLREVLGMVFANTGIDYRVQAMPYPPSCKIPMIITLSGAGDCLFWFHPSASAGTVAAELEGALHDIVQNAFSVSVERGVPA